MGWAGYTAVEKVCSFDCGRLAFVRGRLERGCLERGHLERGRLERGHLERGQLNTAFRWSAAVRSQLATLTSRLEALSTSSESSRSNPYLVPKEPAYEITPDDSILVHYPAMDGKDFFKHKSGNRADDLAYATEMAKEMQSFAKNTTQTYSAPKSALIDWPDSSSHHSSTDKTISRYQSRLANLTRPLDQFATEMFSYEVDPAVAQACLQLAQTMREHIAHLAQQMSSDREDLVYQSAQNFSHQGHS
ncbi:hypothetical protein BCR41DRAFT_392787 [Lobosporangium transversale]|uniref:Uncharacterized protein n=1 Tax=Lobosporangium transversale TaxID=64571 RepID=A0A1Y2GYU5_9FUNG|nr:hypothetical protein BCR41DRAFT_392787 [Lobosporangium transversale]ORZ27457.1 hypothetical protein BCR41DRAFT_392787 [Lobosporangium transversale]|eukprot:XP_021885184.1 hypothetical protein BCR41DRAFT_392787 [Lobosporangium transversale]